ncbi:MAG: hypothetical protein KJ600_01615 [Nanoarchaeota archaeon]|nr:hypothetical protein [Nanoarchaeota archaeon]MBU1103237.1 hypothetical protein [Nanoarchaeota archaeon]
MKNVIRRIFFDEIDEQAHLEFVKFSKGLFQNRHLLEGKKQKDKWAVKTSAEFANFFVRECLKDETGDLQFKGIIVSTGNLKDDCDFPIENIKKYMGISQLVVDSSVAVEKIVSLMEKHPRAFYALSFSTKNCDLKIKAKPPKSGKPGKKGGDGPKADFCSLKTTNKEIVDDLFFDFPSFKEIKIKHEIEITEIEIPEGVENPVELRESAKRKGIVRRIVNVDGREEIKEKEFVV